MSSIALLFRYEEKLAKDKGQSFSNEQWSRIWVASAAKSIEHILPQSKGATERGKPGLYVHRLGNLTLLPLGLNSELSNRDPKDKLDAYIDTGFLCTTEVAKTIEKEGWGEKQAEEREQKLLDWIESVWR